MSDNALLFILNKMDTYRDIQQVTGTRLNTVTAMANNDMSVVALNTMERLTNCFSCGAADLMRKEPTMAKTLVPQPFKETKLIRAEIKRSVKRAQKKRRTARFRKAGLRGLDLSGLDLNEMERGNEDLAGANLSGAILAHANLSSADLTRVNHSCADLYQTTF